MPFNPAIGTIRQLMLGNGRQEASCWPSFPVRLLGKLRPQRLDCRQPKFVEHDAEPCFVDHVGVLHAASPVPIKAS